MFPPKSFDNFSLSEGGCSYLKEETCDGTKNNQKQKTEDRDKLLGACISTVF